jgi:preprotein translocase subunit SecB|nr:MAG TPA: Preprotein translocase subunit SecB [Caudoviricetes sp.]
MSLKMVSADLISCNFKLKNAEKCVYNLELKKYESSEKQQEDGFEYTAILTFDLMSHIRKPVMLFQCSFALVYKGDEEGRQRLKEHIVVAHAIPYLREFVSNLTMRTPIPTLMIDPVNAPELWEQYNSRKSNN